MRIPRLHCPGPLRSGEVVALPIDAARHVSRVLRAKPGDPVHVFNGEGGFFEATVERPGGEAVTARIGAHHPDERESPLPLTLIQGISRGERMDYTLQKAVELGVSAVVAVGTERTVVRLSGPRLEKRVGHWQRVVASACEQCGRNTVPSVHHADSLPAALRQAAGSTGLLLDPEGTVSLRDLSSRLSMAGGATLLAGPEGGFTAAERRQAAEADFLGLRLGPRILRTETAAVAALAGLQALWGDLV